MLNLLIICGNFSLISFFLLVRCELDHEINVIKQGF